MSAEALSVLNDSGSWKAGGKKDVGSVGGEEEEEDNDEQGMEVD